ncbi:MAG: LacI family transcriptional regulator [Gallionellales bacterium GWA2_60_18]|nr:MAG: LacI family transcriptional regulator [Gallionellales bacterium GWA2_60_18]
MTPDWFALLKQAVEGSSAQAVSEKLLVSRTTISLVMSGKYPAKTDKIAARVLDVYARLTCPHTGVEISHAECRALSASAVPTSSPQAMRHWRACQSCTHKGGK